MISKIHVMLRRLKWAFYCSEGIRETCLCRTSSTVQARYFVLEQLLVVVVGPEILFKWVSSIYV